MTISSPVFEPKGQIPPKYTCEGVDVSPPLNIENIPTAAKSLALIMDDPDSPHGVFDHWITWNIPIEKAIKENTVPGIQGKNGFGRNAYGGPCPGSGTHRYVFKLYALDTLLELKAGSDKKALEDAMKGHILATAELTGMYKKMNP